MLLENLTRPEAQQANAAQKIVLLPLGSFEQHGPHLPFTTDTDLVTAVARGVERRRPEYVLCLPTVWTGHSTHHLHFPGTISVRQLPYLRGRLPPRTDRSGPRCHSRRGQDGAVRAVLCGEGRLLRPLPPGSAPAGLVSHRRRTLNLTMKSQRLQDRVALVTGASRGIGHTLALGLAREGAAVVVNFVACATGAEEAVAAIRAAGGRAVAVQADVGRLSDHARLLAAAHENFGPIDILVNNAARARRQSFLEATPAAWDETFDVNLKGLFFLSQAVARTMIPRRSGKIINISSVHDERPLANKSVYTITKGGLKLLTKSLAFELAEHGIQVNGVSPGAILTDETRGVLADPAYHARVIAKIPSRRIGTTEDVVGAVVLLASPESDYMNGSTIYVDGGMLL